MPKSEPMSTKRYNTGFAQKEWNDSTIVSPILKGFRQSLRFLAKDELLPKLLLPPSHRAPSKTCPHGDRQKGFGACFRHRRMRNRKAGEVCRGGSRHANREEWEIEGRRRRGGGMARRQRGNGEVRTCSRGVQRIDAAITRTVGSSRTIESAIVTPLAGIDTVVAAERRQNKRAARGAGRIRFSILHSQIALFTPQRSVHRPAVQENLGVGIENAIPAIARRGNAAARPGDAGLARAGLVVGIAQTNSAGGAGSAIAGVCRRSTGLAQVAGFAG